MKNYWLVVKRVAPLGFVFKTYLSVPRKNGREAWDERHDAQRFSFWNATWQAFRHFAWIESDTTKETK